MKINPESYFFVRGKCHLWGFNVVSVMYSNQSILSSSDDVFQPVAAVAITKDGLVRINNPFF